MFWPPPPQNVTLCHSKLLYNCKFHFHNIKDEHLHIISLHWSCLIWRCYHLMSDQLQADVTVFSNQSLCCSLDLTLSWPKTKLQNMGAGDPSSTILIILPTIIDRLQLGWLTGSVDPGGWEVLRFQKKKYVGRVRVCSDRLKMSHSFIQNCCYINASFTASTMNSWTLSFHW